MADIFISYAHSTEADAQRIASLFRSLGYSVWRDDQLPAHRAFADVIEERLRAAKAVIVVWSADAQKSQWVRAEANVAREAGTLVQLRLDDVVPPLPFNEIQCANLTGWAGSPDALGWQKVIDSVASLLGRTGNTPQPAVTVRAAPSHPLLAVLAFDNLSGDPKMSYFSDGISEEILHTVSRSKGLRVIGKASSFQFRGSDKNVKRVVAELNATHVLDGSVRRSGDQLRISAQLVETASQMTVWSDRYDRLLSDIFALQDEIAAAIAAALDAHFTPAKTSQTVDPAAYDLFLQVRAIYGQDSTNADRVRCVQLLERTVAIAPDFPLAWGQLAMFHGLSLPKTSDEEGDALRLVALSEAKRALSLDPECGPAFTALALTKPAFSHYAEKLRLAERAYTLAPNDSSVAHIHAGALLAVGRNREACRVFDQVVESDPSSPYSLAVRAYFYQAAGDAELAIRMAHEVSAQFPASDYARHMLKRITWHSGKNASSSDRTPEESLERLRKHFAECRPVADLLHVGQAASLGKVDLAFSELLGAIRDHRPIAFDTSPQGRGFSRALTAVGLFAPPFRLVRHDPRFAGVCVKLGLYDHWLASGCWPDCVDEVAPYYDFKAECADAAGVAVSTAVGFQASVAV